jgi:CTP:molybdopterin cytidylyltransferase MocA
MKDIGGIILAAGASSRMGGCKALLPLGDTTPLEREIALFRGVGVERICVVTGFHAQAIRPFIAGPGVFEACNPHPEEGMFSSIRTGIRALYDQCAAMFLLPVDIPLVRSSTLRLVEEQWRRDTATVVIPCFRERSGHPPLVPSALASRIDDWSGPMGLRGFFASIGERIVSVQVPDEHMLMDMDTPEAYERIRSAHEGFPVPSREECLVLLEAVCQLPENIRAHSLMVAGLARSMGETLNRCGERFDLDLLEAAGLLHDIARLEPCHGPRGGRILEAMGFPVVGKVIAPHSDMDVPKGSPFTHEEILFLADKYFRGETPVSLHERYQAKMEQYGINPEARIHVKARLAHALHSEARFQERTGIVLAELARSVAGHSRNQGRPGQ